MPLPHPNTPVRLLAAALMGLAAASGTALAGQPPAGAPAGAQPASQAALEETGQRPHARARVQVVNPIRVGAVVRFRLSGFTPGGRVSATVQPKSAEGANGVGRRLFMNRRASPSGTLVVRMRFPRSYLICSGGAGPCGAYLFKNGERALIAAYDSGEFASITRRLVVPKRR